MSLVTCEAGRCSRYQFECRRGGECIAVYNACDGVPQCADGSDEAPELGCPASPVPPTRPAPPATSPHPAAAANIARATSPPAPALPASQVQVLDSAEDGGNAVNVVSGNDPLVEGPDMWPHRLTQAQPQHRYNSASNVGSGGSHIFSHKGGLLQESAFEPPAPNVPWPRRAWQAPPAPLIDGMDAERGWGAYGRLDWPDTEPRRAWPVPPRPEPEIPVYMPPKTMPEMPMMYSSQRQTLRDSPKKGFDLINQNQPLDFQTEAPALPHPPVAPLVDDTPDQREEKKSPVIENTTKKKVLKDNLTESSKSSSVAAGASAGAAAGAMPHEAAAAALEARERWPPDEHDGLSEHPPAAVLLLVLGTLMTVALGGLLVCRARAARRRRRAHPRLALDADYLVNGMYL
ncbi:unnamed protein product [Euphydryas editha]|uniref:Uncharacterized protein n=1 Tax=Euphydryas editha TaxID=104508 RepID=A0AAU9V8V4_EUPED|nr:unnamed protein product [Euphydryas editha]